MGKIKEIRMKVFRSSIDQLIQDCLDAAIKELNEEIDASFGDNKEAAALKSGIVMLKSRVSVAIRERI